MQSLRLAMFALPLALIGSACSQTGPSQKRRDGRRRRQCRAWAERW